MSDPFLGMIMQVGFNFAPRGWAECAGQILPISQNTALFALLGTMYGGNGQTTFALPDLRSRVSIGAGQGPGLSSYTQGQQGGVENVTLSTANLAAHTHAASLKAATVKATLQLPAAGAVLGRCVDGASGGTSLPEIYCPAGTATSVVLGGDSINVAATGGNQPIATLPPYLAILNVIALEGIFPSRN
jgi:microcystin-dependent protein